MRRAVGVVMRKIAHRVHHPDLSLTHHPERNTIFGEVQVGLVN
jgi:pterin-4a-carbinolamine dehydratase